MDKERKQSEDLYDSEEEGAELFPRHSEVNIPLALELLADNYRPTAHSWHLANCCFRCPLPAISQPYNELRLKLHPDLTESKISSLYANEQFVDLRTVGRSQGGSLSLPQPIIAPVPPHLGRSLDELFQRYGYLPHLERFLLYYPTYLVKHRSVEADLFESGKVEAKSAYFMALCGAAEMGSVYMVNRFLRLYLKSGGQTSWFSSQGHPQKLGLLRQLNRLMARAPWELTSAVIEQVLENEQIHWSRNELAMYLQIMAFSHQNSIISLALGLLPQQDSLLSHFGLSDLLQRKLKYDAVVYQSEEASNEKLAVIIPVLKECEEEGERMQEFKTEISESKKSIKKLTRKVETVDLYMKEINIELTQQAMYKEFNEHFGPLLSPFQVIQKRGEAKNQVLDYSEYNYKFMAYPILNSLTHETADKFEGLIDYSEVMTRGNFGSVSINQSRTKEFRKAVRYYAENLCGYTHHQYDFKNNVSAGLTMALKFYIRLLIMSPLHISRQVLTATNHESGNIECFDLGHLAILIANTKMSLELLMVTQALDF